SPPYCAASKAKQPADDRRGGKLTWLLRTRLTRDNALGRASEGEWQTLAGSGRENPGVLVVTRPGAGAPRRQGAEQAGVSERTAYRRLEDAKFRQRITCARADMIQRAVGKLADAASEAVDTLRDLLHAKSEPTQLGAARTVLEVGSKLRESVEME